MRSSPRSGQVWRGDRCGRRTVRSPRPLAGAACSPAGGTAPARGRPCRPRRVGPCRHPGTAHLLLTANAPHHLRHRGRPRAPLVGTPHRLPNRLTPARQGRPDHARPHAVRKGPLLIMCSSPPGRVGQKKNARRKGSRGMQAASVDNRQAGLGARPRAKGAEKSPQDQRACREPAFVWPLRAQAVRQAHVPPHQKARTAKVNVVAQRRHKKHAH